jgi:mannose-6-phosphate isomerase
VSEPEPIELPLAGPPARQVTKPWGYERIWAETDRYAGKLIAIEAGQRLSLQYHERKEE